MTSTEYMVECLVNRRFREIPALKSNQELIYGLRYVILLLEDGSPDSIRLSGLRAIQLSQSTDNRSFVEFRYRESGDGSSIINYNGVGRRGEITWQYYRQNPRFFIQSPAYMPSCDTLSSLDSQVLEFPVTNFDFFAGDTGKRSYMDPGLTNEIDAAYPANETAYEREFRSIKKMEAEISAREEQIRFREKFREADEMEKSALAVLSAGDAFRAATMVKEAQAVRRLIQDDIDAGRAIKREYKELLPPAIAIPAPVYRPLNFYNSGGESRWIATRDDGAVISGPVNQNFPYERPTIQNALGATAGSECDTEQPTGPSPKRRIVLNDGEF